MLENLDSISFDEKELGEEQIDELIEKSEKDKLDKISNALAAASLVPGLDNIADLAAIPVDLMRGDYMSALFDLVGVIPGIGELGDTAKLARMGIKAGETAGDVVDVAKAAEAAGDFYHAARAVETAGDAYDAAKAAETAGDLYDAAKAVENVEDIYTAKKVDGTIQKHLDSADDAIAEMRNMSKSIAKTSPVKIPDDVVIKPKKTAKGYYHMQYEWVDGKYKYEVRWHTRNPTAPIEQTDVWVVERRILGKNYGKELVKPEHKVLVGDQWIDWTIWEEAKKARRRGTITKEQEEILTNGHWKA